MRKLAFVCVVALVVVSASITALGGTIIEPVAIEAYPTWSAVGIEVSYGGDDNGDATAAAFWRKTGETEWRNAPEVTWDRARGLAWASIWPLDQGETVEVKVTFADPDAEGALKPLSATAVTRRIVVSGTERVLYVGPDGDDAAEGTLEAPFRTLAHTASLAEPGDTVLAKSGVYREGGLFSGLSGTAEKPIVITAAPGEKPVIDGSSTIEAGSVEWTRVDGDVYACEGPFERPHFEYVAQDGLRMYMYRSLEDLVANPQEVPRAWFSDEDAGRLYVFIDGGEPASHTFSLAHEEYGLHLDNTHNIVVSGFEIRNFGRGAVTIRGDSAGCIIIDNVIHNAPIGVLFKDDTTDSNAVWNNEIYERGLTDFSWSAIKASGYSRQGVTGIGGRGNSVSYNTIHGFFDGIAPVSWRNPDRLELNRDFDIMFNYIYNIGDDAIEVDGGGVNMRIHGNRIRNCFAAISLAPVERGPVYCTYNTATYHILMFKLNVGGCTSLGPAYCYHNSAYCLTRGSEYGGTAISFAPGAGLPTHNKTFLNNAFVLDGYAVRYGHENYVIDYNCYHRLSLERPPHFRWEVQSPDGEWVSTSYFSIEEFGKATGRELNGIVADPIFRSTPGLGGLTRLNYGPAPFSAYPQTGAADESDFRLGKGSPCIDAGVVIRGINEDFTGAAPDIGAYETGAK